MSAGKRFEAELRRSLNTQLDSWVHRIVDKTYSGDKFSHKTPADLLCLTPGLDMLIECKARKAVSIPHDALSPHQFDALISFDQLSGHHRGFIAAMLYNGQRGKGRVHRAWMVPITWWAYHMESNKRKSIPMSDLEASNAALEMTWAKPDGWEKYGWVLPRRLVEMCANPAGAGTYQPPSTSTATA